MRDRSAEMTSRLRGNCAADHGARTRLGEHTDDAPEAFELTRLMTWLSPTYPIGAYSYSHGLERAVEAGTVPHAAALASWIEDVFRHGAGRSDVIFLASAWRAVAQRDWRLLAEAAQLAAAFAPSAERRLETLGQGQAFLVATRAAWPNSLLEQAAEVIGGEIAYPVAVGAATAAHGVNLSASARAFAHAFAANLVWAGVRLIPLGQTEGLRIVAGLEPVIGEIAEAGLNATLEDVGGAVAAADIASMQHETQYTRLFRS
jgi:urease accessory protein